MAMHEMMLSSPGTWLACMLISENIRRFEKSRASERPWGVLSPAIHFVYAFAAVLSVHRSIRGVFGHEAVGRDSQVSIKVARPKIIAVYSKRLLET